MRIYRIDGYDYFNDLSSAMIGLNYFATLELAENYLKKSGYYLETRKWENNLDHLSGTKNNLWYDSELNKDGYCDDPETQCRYITKIEVNTK